MAPRAAQPQNAQSIATVCSAPPATRMKALRGNRS